MPSAEDPKDENALRPDQSAPQWMFGRTGRSGTTVTAHAVAGSGPFTLAVIELRFHIDKGGLTDLSNGETSLESLHRAVLGPWYERRTAGGIRGIRQLVNRSTLEKAFDNLLEGDPRALADELWTTGMLEFQQTLSTPVGGAKVCPPNWQREWTGHTTGCGMSFPDAGVVGLPRDPQKQGSVHGASR